jgi:hypothetical protein
MYNAYLLALDEFVTLQRAGSGRRRMGARLAS